MNRRRTSLLGRCTAAWRRGMRLLRVIRAGAVPFLKQHPKEFFVLVLMALVLVGPFILRPGDSTMPSRYNRRLVIMTPHHELIRKEFGHAFAKFWKQKTGEVLYIDWRVQGTSELATMIKSDFGNAFQRHWQHDLKKAWTPDIAANFLNTKADGTNAARAEFLMSNVGIGVDVFFGGGPYDFQAQADAGTLVARDSRTGAGLQRIRERHPDWFGDKAIPAIVSGEAFHDKSMRWCGTCLSSFGIVFNRDVLKRLGIEKEPAQWSDLADPRLRGQVALADPGKSGSVTKAFEMLIQQQMQQAVAEFTKSPGKYHLPTDIEAGGVREGWSRGFALIQKISANARYFTDSSPKIPLEVAKGDAAAGMCIDFYGRSAEEEARKEDGTSRIGFIAPAGGTAVSVDPIALLRGAPEPELGEAFIEFVLSEAGQKLWNYRVNAPGGPEEVALRRLPIRKDMYTPEHLANMTDANEKPFEKAEAFVYHPEWTASMFNVIRFLIRVMCVDPHQELRGAWDTIANHQVSPEIMRTMAVELRPSDDGGSSKAGDGNRALEILHGLQSVGYTDCSKSLSSILRSRDKVPEVVEARRLSDGFRRQYEKAAGIMR